MRDEDETVYSVNNNNISLSLFWWVVHFTHSHIQYSTTGIVTVYVYMGWMDVDKSISQSVLTIDTIIMLWLLFIIH